ncbi:Pentatricopeptide repeat-containing protein At5g46460, mitochondrial, partial [Linum perenne]
SIGSVHKAFEDLPFKNARSWNTIVSACSKLGMMEMARKLFDEMPEPNLVSYNSMISGLSLALDNPVLQTLSKLMNDLVWFYSHLRNCQMYVQCHCEMRRKPKAPNKGGGVSKEKYAELEKLVEELKEAREKLSSSVAQMKKELEECQKKSWAVLPSTKFLPESLDAKDKYLAMRQPVPPGTFEWYRQLGFPYVSNSHKLLDKMTVDSDYSVRLVEEESSPAEWPPLPRVIVRIGNGDEDFDKNNWWYLKTTHHEGGLTMLVFYDGNRSQISLDCGQVMVLAGLAAATVLDTCSYFIYSQGCNYVLLPKHKNTSQPSYVGGGVSKEKYAELEMLVKEKLKEEMDEVNEAKEEELKRLKKANQDQQKQVQKKDKELQMLKRKKEDEEEANTKRIEDLEKLNENLEEANKAKDEELQKLAKSKDVGELQKQLKKKDDELQIEELEKQKEEMELADKTKDEELQKMKKRIEEVLKEKKKEREKFNEETAKLKKVERELEELREKLSSCVA